MIIPLPLATDLAAERAHELRAAATHHRLSRLVRRARRADRAAARPVADTSPNGTADRPDSLPSAA